ncbi:bacillithiol biosynthesis cysteine-adding enzyme BshC [Acidicapsa acidisoli]|uniref:bacillithiol biosynthesis cysteine-adding enzyme BshC n=1 Tax=Acidicapsa acidisoli TaxID=1615681 RepID=UPI0021E08068|nr:bacillithiol biosynthesis cysteine-adding enzyme BshC [Acidicapsa acidisoli]
MTAECFPISVVPGLSRIFLDFCAGEAAVRGWFGGDPRERAWQHTQLRHTSEHRDQLVQLLAAQNPSATLAPALFKFRDGANVVVTGQQVGILGGPLFTPHKAATAVALAGEATGAGHAHVPVFWLASEDHDFAEVNHVTFPARRELRKLIYDSAPKAAVPVGGMVLDESITPLIDQAWELLGYSDAMEWLAAAYRPGQTLAGAFAEFYGKVFAAHGLLVFDAAGREAHRLGAPVLGAAIERADELHFALLERNRELQAAGYHVQVAVAERGSLLFLLDGETGARNALKRIEATATEPAGLWQAGREKLSTDDLLGILASEPERISPSALLRPVFQDQILPTSAYIGGPAEIAYFAQSAVLYERILSRLTPVLPRLTATLVEPAIAELWDRHELTLEGVFASTEESLAQRLAARAMPIAGKRLLASAGNALDGELTALTEYLGSLDTGLGRSAQVSASKMRYQMNRLRRMAANFELQKEASLGRHAQAVMQSLYPHGGLQERLVGAAYYLARSGDGLIDKLVSEAAGGCPGHKLIRL